MLRTRCTVLLLPLVAVAALAAVPAARADQNWKTSSAVWKAMDDCTRAAQKAYPDYTRESNAKREAYRQQCLRNANLPADTAAPPVQQPVQR